MQLSFRRPFRKHHRAALGQVVAAYKANKKAEKKKRKKRRKKKEKKARKKREKEERARKMEKEKEKEKKRKWKESEENEDQTDEETEEDIEEETEEEDEESQASFDEVSVWTSETLAMYSLWVISLDSCALIALAYPVLRRAAANDPSEGQRERSAKEWLPASFELLAQDRKMSSPSSRLVTQRC